MKKLGLLVSGRGSNMQAILNACATEKLQATVEVVISNNQDSAGLVSAKRQGIETVYLSANTHADKNQLDIAIAETLLRYGVDLVILAGFMKKLGMKTLSTFKNRVFNIHPSLLPKFGGQGMYGMRVHEAVIASGETQTGVTVHLVDEDYDKGAILAQESINITKSDTAESLAIRVLKLEHILYAKTIQKWIDDDIKGTNK